MCLWRRYGHGQAGDENPSANPTPRSIDGGAPMNRRTVRVPTLAAIRRRRRRALAAAVVRHTTALVAWMVLMAGLPFGLVWVHRRVPYHVDVDQLIEQPLTIPFVINAAAVFAWGMWVWTLGSTGRAL